MESSMSAYSIANSIRMDVHKGYHILVEGYSDEIFYSKFFNEDETQFFICLGKEKLLRAMDILNRDESFSIEKVIAITDKDYDFLFNVEYPQNTFCTDYHDLEMMCFASESFESIVREFFSEDKLNSKINEDIRKYLLDLIVPIAKLRIVSKKEGYNFKFKASEAKDKELNYNKFICKDHYNFKGYDELINTVKQYYNQAQHMDNSSLLENMSSLNIEEYNLMDICHGHDLTNVITIGLKKAIGKESSSKTTQADFERALRLSFGLNDFYKTKMKKSIQEISIDLIRKIELN